MISILTKFLPFLSFFLCRGADRALTNDEGRTATEVAEMNEQTDLVAALKA